MNHLPSPLTFAKSGYEIIPDANRLCPVGRLNRRTTPPCPSMKLEPYETELVGKWVPGGNTLQADATCRRIEKLIAIHLTLIGSNEDSGGWDTLYRDPDDGRYWERTYPRSELHGGGPPQLRCLTLDEAKMKYSL